MSAIFVCHHNEDPKRISLNNSLSLSSKTGTSIGFKNIASKIAYDLRLWLNRMAANTNNSNATPKNIEASPANEKQSEDNEKQPTSDDNLLSFESGEDVIEISLSECTTPAKTK